MTKRTKNLETLLKSEDNPQTILNAMLKDFDLPTIESKSPTRAKKQKFMSVGTQTEVQINTKEYVSKWLFGPSPSFHPIPADFTYENFDIISKEPPSNSTLTNFDDGSYPNDPVLKQLRKQLKLLAKN